MLLSSLAEVQMKPMLMQHCCIPHLPFIYPGNRCEQSSLIISTCDLVFLKNLKSRTSFGRLYIVDWRVLNIHVYQILMKQ